MSTSLASTADSSLDVYREDFERLVGQDADTVTDGTAVLRRRAMQRFLELGFPNTRQEEWRQTNVATIARTRYDSQQAQVEPTSADIAPLLYDGCRNLVFVDGRLSRELSQQSESGLTVGSLAEGLQQRESLARSVLGRFASFDNHAFVALNSALFRDGAFVSVPPRLVVEQPLHLLHVATAGAEPRVNYPRNLYLLGEQSQVTILETYATLGEGETFTCGVTEMVLEPAATLRHYRHNKESLSARHVSTVQLELARSCNAVSWSLCHGGALVRNDINAVLDGEGIDCTLNGLYLAGGRQHVDHHMRVEHKQPHCQSHQLYKGVLDGRARGVFNGRIFVHDQAQKTDAVQTNRNLLLSDEAIVNSNPQLEIFADDVKCTHGSTIGQLEDEAIFYLRSRGIAEDTARSLLTCAFASELVNAIQVPALKHDLEKVLLDRLPGGELLQWAS